jgi:hypothetical protein
VPARSGVMSDPEIAGRLEFIQPHVGASGPASAESASTMCRSVAIEAKYELPGLPPGNRIVGSDDPQPTRPKPLSESNSGKRTSVTVSSHQTGDANALCT